MENFTILDDTQLEKVNGGGRLGTFIGTTAWAAGTGAIAGAAGGPVGIVGGAVIGAQFGMVGGAMKAWGQ
ncbi:Blp family class II bacteriocin [Leuconostoc sp. MS02]|uniref:Blp family class II bacteriocin n=1 Tax=Leuconostoc aquikimchii TaxID=3236804 RepID=A0ABV3S1Q4_9LACO